MDRSLKRSTGWRSVFVTLTFLALAFKIIVPQGFMVADRGGNFPLVICTGHGPMTMAGNDHGDKAPSQKKSEAPCAFAGNVTPTAPSGISVPSRAYAFVAAALINDHAVDLMPGRGLAAPPPPSHAPPAVSI